MKNICCLFLFIFSLTLSNSQDIALEYDKLFPSVYSYEVSKTDIISEKCNNLSLVWSDEFEDSKLNVDNWIYEIGNGCPNLCGWGNQELQYYKKENLKIQDGKLIITAKKHEKAEHEYTSARIKSEGKFSFKYGKVDVRAKLPKGEGVWPAIWMLGTSIRETGWPVCGEIDIMELRGSKPNTVCGTIHFQNIKGYHEYIKPGCSALDSADFSEDFHVFSLLWDEKELTWLVNDVPYFKSSYQELNINQDKNPFTKDFYLILNLAIGGLYDGNPTEKTVFPQKMEVDYVRVYKLKQQD